MRIRWGRIVIAAVMSEVGVIATIAAGVGLYRLLGPGMNEAEYSQLGEQVGYYVAPASGAILTFLAALWVARPLPAAFVAHGSLTGAVSVLLTVGFLVGARPDHRLMYIAAFTMRLVAGYAGGLFARSRFNTRTVAATGSQPLSARVPR